VPDKWHCYRRARYWYRKALANSAITADTGRRKPLGARWPIFRHCNESAVEWKLALSRTARGEAHVDDLV